MNIFSYPDPRSAFILNHSSLNHESENCICFMNTRLETVPSDIFMKIRRVNPCLADCTGLFTFKGIHIFWFGRSQHHTASSENWGTTGVFRQWASHILTVHSWGSSQPENFPTPKSSSTGCSASPQAISGKVLLPSLISNTQKRRGNGHCKSPICQSLEVHSVYIA